MNFFKYKKRILYFISGLILSTVIAFITCNITFLQNIINNYHNETLKDFETYNWKASENELISLEDPQIILPELDIYVNNLLLQFTLIDAPNDNMILYYQERGDTDFSVEKSVILPLKMEDRSQNIAVNKYVHALRLDLTEERGVALQLDHIEINPRNIEFSFTSFMIGLLTFVFWIILFTFRNFIREIWDSRDILKTLIINDLKSRYAGSFLGMVWAFVQPVLTIIVFWYVFELGFKNPPVDNIQYILWFIPAYIPWMFFSDVAVNAVACISEYSYLVKKMKFKVSVLPIIKVCSSFLIHFCFIIFMVIVFLCYHRKPALIQLQVIYYCFALCVFLIGLSWLISAIAVFVKDFAQIINVVLQLGFFMIPIFWNPNAMSAVVLKVLKLNPLYYIVQGYRESMIDGISFLTHPELTIYFWFITLIIFVTGAKLFDKVHVHFADLL